jgi:hypothetical protein
MVESDYVARTLSPVTPLARLILSSGKSSYVVAAEVGINPTRLGDYANGRVQISAAHRTKLADYFGADPVTGEPMASANGGGAVPGPHFLVTFWASLGQMRAPPGRDPVATLVVRQDDMDDVWSLTETAGRWLVVWMAMDGDHFVTRKLPEEADGLWWRRCAEASVVDAVAADTRDGPVLRVKLRVAQRDRDSAFELLAPGGASAPPPGAWFSRALFAVTGTDEPPAVDLIPIATRVEAHEWDGDEDEMDNREELDCEGVNTSLASGYERTIVLLREALDYGDAREKLRAMEFFAKEAEKQGPLGHDRRNGREEAIERFQQLMAEIRDVSSGQPSSVSERSPSTTEGHEDGGTETPTVTHEATFEAV